LRGGRCPRPGGGSARRIIWGRRPGGNPGGYPRRMPQGRSAGGCAGVAAWSRDTTSDSPSELTRPLIAGCWCGRRMGCRRRRGRAGCRSRLRRRSQPGNRSRRRRRTRDRCGGWRCEDPRLRPGGGGRRDEAACWRCGLRHGTRGGLLRRRHGRRGTGETRLWRPNGGLRRWSETAGTIHWGDERWGRRSGWPDDLRHGGLGAGRDRSGPVRLRRDGCAARP
jgi:hypothetical protein